MYTMTSVIENDASLGPVLTTEVELEGSCVKALIDTGYPVTIVSLKFLVDALKKCRPPDQFPADWRACVRKRMKPTTLSLQTYGGEVNLVREVKVTIKRAAITTDATIQVQAGAPIDLLLGTDVQPRLGFVFLALIGC